MKRQAETEGDRDNKRPNVDDHDGAEGGMATESVDEVNVEIGMAMDGISIDNINVHELDVNVEERYDWEEGIADNETDGDGLDHRAVREARND